MFSLFGGTLYDFLRHCMSDVFGEELCHASVRPGVYVWCIRRRAVCFIPDVFGEALLSAMFGEAPHVRCVWYDV